MKSSPIEAIIPTDGAGRPDFQLTHAPLAQRPAAAASGLSPAYPRTEYLHLHRRPTRVQVGWHRGSRPR